MNHGERNEYLLKFMLIQLRDGKVSIPSPIKVNCVGFGNREYHSFPSGLTIRALLTYSDDKLVRVAEGLGIGKSPSRAKSDVHINGIGFSVKSLESAPPAIVNHTTRVGFENACRYSGADLQQLDYLIDQYWKLREEGIIGEDVKNSSYKSPFRQYKAELTNVLEYFLFEGTGIGISQFPADYILDYSSPINPSTWRILSKEDAIEKLWDNLIFSVRSKGMPDFYPNNRNTVNNERIGRWTRYINGQYRGALHIRASR